MTITVPPSRHVGDPGHVADHELIRAALLVLDAWQTTHLSTADPHGDRAYALSLFNQTTASLTITTAVTVTDNGDSPIVTWGTNLPGGSRVDVGTAPGVYDYLQSPFIQTESVTQHSVTLNVGGIGLANGTYYAQVTTDAPGLTSAVSPEFSFVVNVAGDVLPPTITLVPGSANTTDTTQSYNVTASETTTITKKIRPHFTGGGGGGVPNELARGTVTKISNASGAASMSCAIPSGYSGKYALVVFWTEGTTTNFASSLSSACTTILSGRGTDTSATGTRINVFGRRLDGSEGSAITATPSASTDYMSRCYIFDNVDATTPLDAVTAMETDLMTVGGTSASPFVSTQATGTSANALAFCVLVDNPQGVTGQSVTVSGASWLEADDQSGTNRVHGALAKQQLTGGGDTGSCTWTLATGAKAISATFSLRSAGSGAGGTYTTVGTDTNTSFQILYSGLTANTTYDFLIESVDLAGNVGNSLSGTFTTSGSPPIGGTGNLSSYLFGTTTGTVNVVETQLHATSLPDGGWDHTTNTGGRGADLILVAPGWTEGMAPTCVVLDRAVLHRQNRVIFKGFKFAGGINFGSIGKDQTYDHFQCDRIGLYDGEISVVSDPTVAWSSTVSTDISMGLSVNGSSHCWLWGTLVHTTADDLMHVNMGGFLALFGIRGYSACVQNGVHADFCQVMSGTVYAEGCVSGVPKGVHPATYPTYVNYANGGHGGSTHLPASSIQGYGGSGFELHNDAGAVTGTVKDFWACNSDRIAVTADNTGKGGGAVNVVVQNIASWGLSPNQNQTSLLKVGSPSVQESNVTFNVVPSSGTTPPDEVLLAANATWATAKAKIAATTSITFS